LGLTGGALADACALVAYFSKARGMSRTSYTAIESGALVSPVTVWELTLKSTARRLPELPSTNGSFAEWLLERGLRVQPLTWADAERANHLPPIHKDPMDRMLIAQALNAGLTIITNDAHFAAYGVATIW
jgi:PIN domain nuclease of toxin-antitoxin system